MEITGEKVINAPRDLVFAALHDPAAMRQAIPGCQRFAEIGENRYEAEIALKIGPIGGTFAGLVRVFNVDPPMGHSLNAEAAGTTGGG
ncbi:MAG: SRPBCC domain-containing protein, partial [Pseudomonadota bacterium]